MVQRAILTITLNQLQDRIVVFAKRKTNNSKRVSIPRGDDFHLNWIVFLLCNSIVILFFQIRWIERRGIYIPRLSIHAVQAHYLLL